MPSSYAVSPLILDEKDAFRAFSLFALFSLFTVSIAAFSDYWILCIVPAGILVSYFLFTYPREAFLGFFAILPFSIEVYFSNGLGTDLPTEPLILLFCTYALISIPFWSRGWHKPSVITILIFLHLVWIGYAAIYAEFPAVSLKFLVAKLWYVIPFYLLTQRFFSNYKSEIQELNPSFFSRWVKWFLIGLAISVVYVMVRHFSKGFSFDTIGWAVSPIYRNHVNYAALLSIGVALCYYKIKYSAYRISYILLLSLFLGAIYFSYTRAAMAVVIIMLVAYALLKYRLLFISGIIALFLGLAGLLYMSIDNRYLHYAPNYESTVAHTKFDNLIEATYELEDISTMERVNRWVAGFKMVSDRPVTGYGPNNFYFNYKAYTNNSFQTYVSDNPDKSGIHNYYLMTAVEQGVIGLLIWLFLLFSAIFIGERKYHRSFGQSKTIIAIALLILVNIMTLILINDLIEAVKVGPFLFISLGIINRA